MKKITILIFTILLISSCSQKELSFENLVERNDLTYEINNENTFSGKAFSKYENLQFKEIGFFEDGKKVGVWEYFAENGQILKKTSYDDNKLNGLYKEFENDGKKIKTIEYKNNLKNGLSEEFNNEGLKISSINYTRDTLDGFYKTFYFKEDKNVILEEGNYKMNKKNGLWAKNNDFYREEFNYLNGKLNGNHKIIR